MLRIRRKTQTTCALLLVCLFALASLACLLHTEATGEGQEAYDGHGHPSASSSMQSLPDLHCLVAVLPTVMVLVWLYLGVLYSVTRFSRPTVLAFPPFIPPKTLRHI